MPEPIMLIMVALLIIALSGGLPPLWHRGFVINAEGVPTNVSDSEQIAYYRSETTNLID